MDFFPGSLQLNHFAHRKYSYILSRYMIHRITRRDCRKCNLPSHIMQVQHRSASGVLWCLALNKAHVNIASCFPGTSDGPCRIIATSRATRGACVPVSLFLGFRSEVLRHQAANISNHISLLETTIGNTYHAKTRTSTSSKIYKNGVV